MGVERTTFAVGDLLGTARQLVRHGLGDVDVDVLLVMVAQAVVQLLVDAAREDEGRERVEVGQ